MIRGIHLVSGKIIGHIAIPFLTMIDRAGAWRNKALPGLGVVVELAGCGMFQCQMENLVAGLKLFG